MRLRMRRPGRHRAAARVTVATRWPYIVGMAAWALLQFAHGPSLPISTDTDLWAQYLVWHAWPASIKWAARRSIVRYKHAGKRRAVRTRRTTRSR